MEAVCILFDQADKKNGYLTTGPILSRHKDYPLQSSNSGNYRSLV